MPLPTKHTVGKRMVNKVQGQITSGKVRMATYHSGAHNAAGNNKQLNSLSRLL